MTSRSENSLVVSTREAFGQLPTASRRILSFFLISVFALSLVGFLPSLGFNEPSSAFAQDVESASIGGVVGGGGATVWDKETNDLVAELLPGALVTVYTRSDDDKWVFVETEELLAGWAASDEIIVVRRNRLPSEDVSIAPVQAAPEPAAMVADDSGEETLEGSVAAAETETLTTTETVSQTFATVIVEDSRLNIRSGAGADHPIVAKALPGESYPVTDESADGDWIQIELTDGEEEAGWVSAAYVSLSDEKPSAKQRTASAMSRSAASTSAPMMASAAPAGLGGKLVFQNRGGDGIYLYDLRSGRLNRLTYGIDPALSPDGSQIAFTRSNNENGIYIINTDGSNEHQIFGERDWLRSPKWSPDGKRIVFVRGDELTDCYVLPDGRCMEIEWINANKPWLDLGELRKTQERKFNLARVDVDGGNYTDLVAISTAKAPDWSNRGIVYQSRAGIQITEDKQDAETQLVYFDILKQYHHDPDWQQNGGQILFDQREASHWEIYTINSDGSGRRALTHPEFTLVDELPSNVTPAWSPDGRYIAFLSNREPDHEAGAWRIWIMNADGSNQRPLPINVPIEYGFDDAQMVDWGP